MGSFSIWHWLIVLVIVMLVFGTKKLRNIGEDLGGAVKGFKQGIKDGADGSDKASEATSTEKLTAEKDGQTLEGQAREKNTQA